MTTRKVSIAYENQLMAYHNPLIQPLTDELAKDPDNPQLLYQRGMALLQVEAPEMAKKDLIHALQKDSNNL